MEKYPLTRKSFSLIKESFKNLHYAAETMAIAIWPDTNDRHCNGISSFLVVLNNMRFVDSYSHSDNVKIIYEMIDALKVFRNYNDQNHVMLFVMAEIDSFIVSAIQDDDTNN